MPIHAYPDPKHWFKWKTLREEYGKKDVRNTSICYFLDQYFGRYLGKVLSVCCSTRLICRIQYWGSEIWTDICDTGMVLKCRPTTFWRIKCSSSVTTFPGWKYCNRSSTMNQYTKNRRCQTGDVFNTKHLGVRMVVCGGGCFFHPPPVFRIRAIVTDRPWLSSYQRFFAYYLLYVHFKSLRSHTKQFKFRNFLAYW
jgi:hypothetical protein